MHKNILLFLFAVSICNGLIHDLKIHNDKRQWFFIENFGFETNGEYHMTVLNFTVGGEPLTDEYKEKVAFLIKRTETDSTAFLEQNPSSEECVAAATEVDDIVIYLNTTSNGRITENVITVRAGEEGFYNTYFVSCANQPISFELKLTQFNVDSNGTPNYLSAGLSKLPSIYALYTVCYAVCLIVWIFHFLRAPGAKNNRIHHLMTSFIVLKMMSLLFDAIRFHYIGTVGSAAVWTVLYFIFAFVKGIMLFVLIALIGTGWSFVKPFLSDKDKKIFMVVIPLQVLDNIAMIVVEETAPGSQGWFTWKDIFRLVDIICCGAILIPIIWSIKHLREAVQTKSDAKAARNLKKLTLFRQFYLMVVSYIYFTRIIVYLVDATLPFRWTWLGDFFAELATIVFLGVTGYKFRPTPENPYFHVEEEVEMSTQIPL